MGTEEVKRDTWGRPLEFILACLGYAVGLGNVWRFPYLCGRNGGAAFLIPYFIMLFIAGLPIFYVELGIGQYGGLSPVRLYERMFPLFSGLGAAMMLVQAYTACYYNMIMAWALFYLGHSFQSPLPWSKCTNYWNTRNCYDSLLELDCKANNTIYYEGRCWSEAALPISLNEVKALYQPSARVDAAQEFLDRRMLKRSPTIEEFGYPDWELVVCLLVAWILVYICLCGGTKTSGKVVYFTATFPYLILLVLVIRGCTLDGAHEGVMFFLSPNTTLLATSKVWSDAAQQIFFSLSLGGGGLTTLASYNNFRDNIFLHTLIVVLGNSLTSFFAAFAIFPVIGYMAKILKKPVRDVAKGGITLAFTVFPSAISRIPLSPLWAVLFFFMLVLLAIDSQIVLAETPITGILDTWPQLRRGWRKPVTVACMCFLFFLVGLIFTTPAGAYVLTIVDTYGGGYPLVFLCTIEIACIMWIYGFRNFVADLRLMLGKPPNMFYKILGYPVNWYYIIMWVVITPIVLFAIMIFQFIEFSRTSYDDFYTLPVAADVCGWLLCLSTVLCIPIFGIIKFIQYRKKNRPFTALLRPTPEWCPKTENNLNLSTVSGSKVEDSAYTNRAYGNAF